MTLKEDVKIKCVVWDLDHTIWNGTLLEDSEVELFAGILDAIHQIDQRGIIQSIASKNNHDQAVAKLQQFGLDDFFLYPQVNWNPKSSSIKTIAESLNIGLDSIAFIDDTAYEREEVSFSLPEVLCIDASEVANLLDMPQMNPRFITEDSKKRRAMYLNDMQRKTIEEEFEGTQEEFLASLRMVFTISPVQEGDLERAEELTVRTHQLNTTGYTYSYEELNRFRSSKDHILLMAELEDKFGAYGKIGMVLLECQKDVWVIKLLLMSCRVMSRGVGTVFLSYISEMAKAAGVRLRAEYINNDRNRMMLITFKFNSFKEVMNDGTRMVFECDPNDIQSFPSYITVKIKDEVSVD